MSEPAHALHLPETPDLQKSDIQRLDIRKLDIQKLDIRRLPSGLIAPETPSGCGLSNFTGRFAEISGSEAGASLTLVFRLVLEAQRQQDPTVWIARRGSVFFPPDAMEAGIDLDALPVVRAPEAQSAARVADYLIRSGGFGLVVVDLGPGARWPVEIQTRLTGLAQKHETALVSLTEKEDHHPSLGSLVSLRAHTTRTSREGSRFRCEAHVLEAHILETHVLEVHILKDKRYGPGRKHTEVFDGPHGLR
jgi:recombination protein RecA